MDIRVLNTVSEDGGRILREFVAEVLTVCANDDGDNGGYITWGLEDKALEAGAELGMTMEEMKKLLGEE
jgi:hypothetical protein